MNTFEFNVPRFTAFNSSSDSDDDVEKYFDFDHECEDDFNTVSQSCFLHDKTTEENGDAAEFQVGNDCCKSDPKKRRSVFKTPRKSELAVLCDLNALTLNTPKKIHLMETRQDSAMKNPPLSLRSRSVVRESVAPEQDCKDITGKRKRSTKNQSAEAHNKFICLAEEVLKFHSVTPARFHTKPRNETFHRNKDEWRARASTIPVSPHLKVLKRNRPNHALSRKQLEDLEVEEMKRHQLKARPINEKILKPPNINCSQRSFHVTEFKPFNLTEFKKKVEEPRPAVVKFTARPVPKGLFNKVDVKNTSAPILPSHRSHSPGRIRVPVMKTKEKENQTVSKPPRKGPIKATPFSFYDSDIMRLKHKEEKIKELLEEEKKQRQFHANPLPKFPEKPFQEKATIIPTIQQPFRLSADDKGKANKEKWEKKLEEEKMQLKKAAEFKARPPVILHKKPFIPVKTDKHEVKTLDVHLNTEIRAKERALFDLKMQMREKEMEELKLQRQKELDKIEEEEVSRLRKETVHKANPIRHFKDVSIHPADKSPTVPLSPKSFCKQHEISCSDFK